MPHLAPPETPPLVTTDDDGRLRRVHFRLFQILVSLATVLTTTWIITLGSALLSIIAVAIAKHVLVAIFVMGLELYRVPRRQQ